MGLFDFLIRKAPTRISTEALNFDPAAYTRHDVKRTILMCTDERSGSHLLAQNMASTGVLGRPYEYFNTPWMRGHRADYPEDVASQLELAKLFATTPNGTFSVKVHPLTMDHVGPHIDFKRDLPDVTFVWLTREDLLAQAISLAKAHQTNEWTSTRKVVGKSETTYDPQYIYDCMQNLAIRKQRWELYFARNGISPVRVTYEELTANAQRVITKISKAAHLIERPRINRQSWHRFEKQADATSEEWASRFRREMADLERIDIIRQSALESHNG